MSDAEPESISFPVFDGALPRDRLLNALKADLLGPEDSHEVLRQSPKTRYLVGMLAPSGTGLDAAEDDQDLAAGEDDEGTDGKIHLGASLEASSIGLSVVADIAAASIAAVASWGEYSKVTREIVQEVEPEDRQDLDREQDPGDLDDKKTKQVPEWRRHPRELELKIPLGRDGEGGTEERGVHIRYLVRSLHDTKIVSVFLNNGRETPPGHRPSDEDYLYQPVLSLHGDGAPFLPRQLGAGRIDPDPDIASADLIYRKRHEFAVGHGVAPAWPDEAIDRVTRVWTDIIPAREVPKVTPRESDLLSMDALADEDRVQVQARLRQFLAEYETWITARDAEADDIDSPIRAVAIDHLLLARNSLRRMHAGINTLDNSDVFASFQFANRAMALQRRRSVQVRARRRAEPIPTDDDIVANWRPFQLGFVLQALEGLVDPTHDDREIADLLWFPTGGGKTEAYLGLTAFVFALRRRHPDDMFQPEAGTAVIMRYTLRLLTIQQFQRALTLVAACEHLRAADTKSWGDERFTIGLWVGQSVTPNTYDDARAALNKLKNDQEVYEKSPYQVLFCPWCGDDIKPAQYVTHDDTERVQIRCWNLDCDYGAANTPAGIPALVVDEEIYRHPPTLLLATVDKFAQMTWNGRIQSLFGRVERNCPRHGWITAAEDHAATHDVGKLEEAVVTRAARNLAPPDLIIQDELHLISGPLGTLVGLYESAVDELCSRDAAGQAIRPKVVASTATVRRAKRQVRSLFDREIAVFPPQGLDASDSFFATESDDEPGRLYVGIFGPGKSIKTTLVRTYGALLGRALVEFEADPTPQSDAYMTLVGYFNSLRELGGAVRLVEDDVRSRLRALKRRGFSDDRVIYESWELTSRKSSSRISATLEALDRTFLDKQAGAYPIDVLLASNMISVGVDIDRLGLMVVSAQPKTTAEYIQATSRVGRSHPGLVVQVYNWVRPRDISHYERFRHYHATFYRHVEATSVTPFSERARDRALPAVLVAHTRSDEPTWSAEQCAGAFDADTESVQAFRDFLVERSRHVAAHGDEVAEETRQQLNKHLFDWDQLTDHAAGLVYSHRGQDKQKSKAVLLQPMEIEAAKGLWKAAGSLREVEEEIPIVLKDYGGND